MASTQVTPTRMELTRTKKKLVTAIKGHKLLKDKRDELMRQFLDLVKVNMELREKVEAGIRSANKNFVIAKAGIQCNLCYGELCGQQKVSGIIKPSGIHIIWESGVELFRKYSGEDKTADTEFSRETVQGQFLRVVGIQIEK